MQKNKPAIINMTFPERFRVTAGVETPYRTYPGDPFGAFMIPGRDAYKRTLRVIADNGNDPCMRTGWQHVSVSLYEFPSKTPSWEEMCLVKRLFWPPTACVIQFHPPEAAYVNQQEVLHLWRSIQEPFPLPHRNLV